MLQGFLAFLLVSLCSFDLQAQTPFYQGKTITIIVAAKAGDVYDLYPRLLAEFLPSTYRAIPISLFKTLRARPASLEPTSFTTRRSLTA
jgi:hypothetical protein